MNRNRIAALGAVLLVLLPTVVASCAERDLDPGGDGPVASVAAPLVEALRFEDVRTVEVSLFPGGDALVSGAFCRHTPPFVWADRLAEAGPCRLLHWRPVERISAVNLDTGAVTVEVAGASVELKSAADAPPCFRIPTAELPELRAGDEIRVWSTGGADVPPFDLRIVVPDGPNVGGPAEGRAIRAGEPWTVEWTGPDHDAFVEVRALLDGTGLVASCRGLSGTSLSVPPELTAVWPADLEKAQIGVGVERVVSTGGELPVKLLVRRVDAAGLALATVAAP